MGCSSSKSDGAAVQADLARPNVPQPQEQSTAPPPPAAAPAPTAAAPAAPAAAAGSTLGACRLRIFHINDVSEIDNLATLRTAVEAMSEGIPRSNVLVTLAGDFLAPSLGSMLDRGRGMIDMLNAIPVGAVCFGTHEADLPHPALLQRINEFEGVWLNSNMRSMSEQEEDLDDGKAPDNHVLSLQGGRTVGLIGLCCGGGKDAPLYRDGAFNGHAEKITPVLEAADGAVTRVTAASSGTPLDCVVPLTHQDLADDVALAGRGHRFPVILGGHDHGVVDETHHGCRVVKAGDGAFDCAVVDLHWEAGAPAPGPPTSVTTQLVPLALRHSPAAQPAADATEPTVAASEAAAAEAFKDHGVTKVDLEQAFKVFDKDGSGSLDASELKAILTQPVGGKPARLKPEEVDALIAKYDANGDGVLSVEEFASAWAALSPWAGIDGRPAGANGLPYGPHGALLARIQRWKRPQHELEGAVLAQMPTSPPLTSVDASKRECTMGTLMATALRTSMQCDAALVRAAGVRANREYAGGKLTFAQLRAECDEAARYVAMRLDGATLSAAVQQSRAPWRGAAAGGGGGGGVQGGAAASSNQPSVDVALDAAAAVAEAESNALHGDDGLYIDGSSGAVLTVGKATLEPHRLYLVLVETAVLRTNPALKYYVDGQPGKVPPADAGRPVLPSLVGYFCDRVWRRLADTDGDGNVDVDELDRLFEEADLDGSGRLDGDELKAVIEKRLGYEHGSNVLAQQCVSVMDKDADGTVSRLELYDFFSTEAEVSQAIEAAEKAEANIEYC